MLAHMGFAAGRELGNLGFLGEAARPVTEFNLRQSAVSFALANPIMAFACGGCSSVG